jgi:isoleucyl-tRNA synthetase
MFDLNVFFPVPEKLDIPKEEDRILKFWKDIKAFETSLKKSEGKKIYTFYDGPPFATGLPHYGHMCAGTIKVKLRKNFSLLISNYFYLI